MKRLNNQSAFTLVEVFLGLLIFSIIGYTVYSVFYSGVKLSKRAEAIGAVHRQVFWSLETLSRELENMAGYDFSGSYPKETAFAGEADQLRFLLATDDGLRVIRYYLDVPEDSEVHKVVIGRRSDHNVGIVQSRTKEKRITNLMREEIPLTDFLNRVDGEREIMCDLVEEDGLKLFYGYRSKTEGSDTVRWEDEWELPALPAGVRIELTLANPDDPQTPVRFRRDVFVPTGSWGE